MTRPQSRMPAPLGKRPKKFDHRTLQFARYLRVLPVPPTAVDRASRLPLALGMMTNDKYGSCTIAAAGHQVQSWTLYAERGMLTIPDSEILKAYLAISPQDQGAYMLDALNYWRKTGVGPDKIEAFVEIAAADLVQHKLGIQYFGSTYIGMSLPDVNTFGPWDVPNPTWRPNPYNGHAVCLLGYDDATSLFDVATWGEKWKMSYAWLRKYCDEAYAILNDISVIASSGKTPSGFDFMELQGDLAHLGDPVTPPEPTPDPVPPGPGPAPPTPSGVMAPVFTQKVSTNITVEVDGVVQALTHVSPYEACEHAGKLKLADPARRVLINSMGVVECTLEKVS